MVDIRKKRYSWEDYHTTVWQLGNELGEYMKSNVLKGLIAISRGGLIPATLLSHQLRVPVVDVLLVRSYAAHCQGAVEIQNALQYTLVTNLKQYLIIDDIVDSGNTIDKVKLKYPEARFAASIGKNRGIELQQQALVVRPPIVVPDDLWIEFPWEQ